MKKAPGEQMDELFVGIRLKLVKLRQSDPEVVEELKSLLSQVEDSVESLIIDSLKLKSLEQAAKTKKAPREKGKQSK
ncbi:MAG: hypothetical protein PHI12_03285 [Dehalococcoidales bacterium]|nr:hypothetical protein [Dehalococcoidales bacterium]